MAHLQIAQSQLHLAHAEEAVATLRHFLQDPRAGRTAKNCPRPACALGQIYHDQKKYAEALAVWREYLSRDTAHEGWSAVQRSIIDTEYLVAIEKFKAGDDAAASKLLAEFMDRYPLDSRNPGILFSSGRSTIGRRNGKRPSPIGSGWRPSIPAAKRPRTPSS